jgi:hypothetical protein
MVERMPVGAEALGSAAEFRPWDSVRRPLQSSRARAENTRSDAKTGTLCPVSGLTGSAA